MLTVWMSTMNISSIMLRQLFRDSIEEIGKGCFGSPCLYRF